jgi:AbrB family looped-hinge helix DNA binding protein
MTHRIGTKGQVVIPKEIRDQVGLHPGMEVEVTAQGERVVVTLRRPRSNLGGQFKGSGMAARLLHDRAREPR